MKYVLIIGGVVSGLGKGVTASSIGVVLKACGLRVTSIKIDPYLNIDAGTMSPFEHGEVFVLDDGREVDLDLGNYERFLDVTLTKDNNITTGKIYQSVLEKELDGNEGLADVYVIELGGTVGDIESMPFIEALRKLSFQVGPDNFCLIHVSLIPVLGVVGKKHQTVGMHYTLQLFSLFIFITSVLQAQLSCSHRTSSSIHCYRQVARYHQFTSYQFRQRRNFLVTAPASSGQPTGINIPTVAHHQHHHRAGKTVTAMDVVYELKRKGRTLYGFGVPPPLFLFNHHQYLRLCFFSTASTTPFGASSSASSMPFGAPSIASVTAITSASSSTLTLSVSFRLLVHLFA
ncbi:unnamed protein product [Vicia faba]|uniref:CTP synthase N-terminal domain-containing protein n=1 Tax=Vicia faba TaxID=3906 RepID=A0AAV1B8D7_VICFA|nr:unnamed protein product [Vicia faba]